MTQVTGTRRVHTEDGRRRYDIAYRGVEGVAEPAEVINAKGVNQGNI